MKHGFFAGLGRRRLSKAALMEEHAAFTNLARLTQRLADTNKAHLEKLNVNAMLPAQQFMHRRRLADATRMAAKDVYSMSSSQLATHRRRLKYGVRVSDVLAALMEEVEDHQYRY